MFISISTFSSLYSSQSDLLTEEGKQAFIDRLNSAEAIEICRKNGIERWNLDAFVRTLKFPENLVFYGWVAQTSSLEKLLHGTFDGSTFTDANKHLEHHLGKNYQRFLSPYLSKSLLKFTGEDKYEILANLLSYTKLLDEDHCATVEAELFKPIKKSVLAASSQYNQVHSEQALVELVQPLCQDEIVKSVNNLSKSSYVLKLMYVDEVLKAIKSRSCTVRLANWILKQLDQIHLNKEHQYKLIDLRADLQKGNLTVNNGAKGRMPFPWKLTVALVLILGVLLVVLKDPFGKDDPVELSDNTSFKQFTKEERMKIDSLLQEMKGDHLEEEDFVDQGMPILGGASATLTMRKAFDNPTMERIYDDLNKDAELQEQGYNDSCRAPISYRALPGVLDLKDKSGAVEIMIRNESAYDVVLYVSDDYSGGEVHAMFLKQGEIKTFFMDKGNTILAVPGNNYQPYFAPKSVDPADLPSAKYDYHFCETDYNYIDAINTPYILNDTNGGKTKFMLSGNSSGYFDIVDIYGVLEVM